MKIYNTPITAPVPLFAPGTVLNANLNSAPMQLQHMFGFSIQLVWTGTPTGTFKLQGSSDSVYVAPRNTLSPETPVNWTDIANSSEAVSAAGSFMWNVSDAFYNFVRVVYTDASSGASTAAITVATMNGKGM